MRMMKSFITYGFYPFLLLATGVVCWLSIENRLDLPYAFTVIAATRFALLQGVEFIFPMQKRWGIRWKEFWRDVKFGAANLVSMRLVSFLIGFITIDMAAGNPGLLEGAPLWLDIIGTALLFEFLQYWFHRFSHEGGGWLGRKLWQVHVAHHLPDRVYLIMHGVGHPINFLVVLWMVPLTTWITGASQEAVMVWFSFRGLHGLLSHYNVDIRAGWLNYLFVGTELHRYHHSADVGEAKNYGSFLILWDQLFGTFVYKPGKAPDRLGVDDPGAYPESYQVLKVLSLPFQSSSTPVQEVAIEPAPPGGAAG
ncbi:sterol desaturase family protein [Kordiimonas lacus]|uniref:Sterol desaturase/sphingolipid hydroxylase, fatty acid hydroxylase superfamily n=1 Tax=Kordiimonas lacus TaxID=637679 RepID=A0A1G6T3T8_9PROT|nr:sterol desaturase family protein [Kordiimonas lacus]SDD23633.1 Sterol desaturase/sphingolipid hydroxylase, fatty acid hydroxylase superfamily [Kordiimonas lacus]